MKDRLRSTTGALVPTEVVDSKGSLIRRKKSTPKMHITQFKMSHLGFAIPFARAFALSAGITAAGPDVMSAIANRTIDGASALMIAKKAAPALLGFATLVRTYRSFTLHGKKDQSFGLRLMYALDLQRSEPMKAIAK